MVSPLDALPAYVPHVDYALGCDAGCADTAGFPAAAAAAAAADATVVALGLNCKLTGEGVDRGSLALPGSQDGAAFGDVFTFATNVLIELNRLSQLDCAVFVLGIFLRYDNVCAFRKRRTSKNACSRVGSQGGAGLSRGDTLHYRKCLGQGVDVGHVQGIAVHGRVIKARHIQG
jgi:hypothetical protein